MPGSPLYLGTMALVLWIKAARLLDGLASDLPARVLVELRLLRANMHPVCISEWNIRIRS